MKKVLLVLAILLGGSVVLNAWSLYLRPNPLQQRVDAYQDSLSAERASRDSLDASVAEFQGIAETERDARLAAQQDARRAAVRAWSANRTRQAAERRSDSLLMALQRGDTTITLEQLASAIDLAFRTADSVVMEADSSIRACEAGLEACERAHVALNEANATLSGELNRTRALLDTSSTLVRDLDRKAHPPFVIELLPLSTPELLWTGFVFGVGWLGCELTSGESITIQQSEPQWRRALVNIQVPIP